MHMTKARLKPVRLPDAQTSVLGMQALSLCMILRLSCECHGHSKTQDSYAQLGSHDKSSRLKPGFPDAQTSVLGMQALEPMYDTQTQL